jgi:hypothetical protein
MDFLAINNLDVTKKCKYSTVLTKKVWNVAEMKEIFNKYQCKDNSDISIMCNEKPDTINNPGYY